ncbi:hypothetical protein AB0I53_48645 [Saccharopolyspora sp. NPDC050389]|uniref:hypothetical protein n=1 Tax=Saccharopolyspora sp. NPDC050389 TaxID=3155516 RepID=UPI0033DED328
MSRNRMVNLEHLRAPLTGMELVCSDHTLLTWIADQDDDVVVALADLLARARAACPLTEHRCVQLDGEGMDA